MRHPSPASPALETPQPGRPARERRPWSGVYPALFLFLFALYLLTYTPRINSSDGLAMFATAESLVRRGAFDIEQIRWLGLQQGTYGLDGLLYSRKGLGLPLGLLPLAWLGLLAPWWGPVGASLLFNALVTALTATLLLVYVQQLGFSRPAGLSVALLFGLATPAWPYAKSLFSDPLSGFLLLAAAVALLHLRRRFQAGTASLPGLLLFPFLAGLCLAWNVATRYAEVIFVPIFGLLLLYYLWPARTPLPSSPPPPTSQPLTPTPQPPPPNPQPLLPLLAFALPLLLTGLALVTFNLFRYGDPFNTGYLPNETFSGSLWQGLVGQLVSPGRGLFLYAPVLVLCLWGVLPLFRQARAEALLAGVIILVHLFLYGKWFMWHGGYAWGPRFMVPTLPFWAVFLAPVVSRAVERGKPASVVLRVALAGLILAGLWPQFLGLAVDFTHFQNALLDPGLPLFAPVTFFDPRYSPLLGTWAYLTGANLDLAWAWQGQVAGWLLAILGANVLLAGLTLGFLAIRWLRTSRDSSPQNVYSFPAWVLLLPALLVSLLAAGLLLAHVHTLPPRPLAEAVAELNRSIRPQDAVITNDPEIAAAFAELYRGRPPVLGLNAGGFPLPADITKRLEAVIAGHPQVWWLPNWLPPEQSAVEQMLLAAGFRARNDDFGGQRLALFALPASLPAQAVPSANFGEMVRLKSVAYPESSPAGAALPIELQWQATAPPGENYHVFIHLLNPEGQMAAQADGQPAVWARPTSTWSAGETIVDRHALWLPPDTPPGRYLLRLGLYRPADGQRLTLANGDDQITLEVMIRPESQ